MQSFKLPLIMDATPSAACNAVDSLSGDGAAPGALPYSKSRGSMTISSPGTFHLFSQPLANLFQ